MSTNTLYRADKMSDEEFASYRNLQDDPVDPLAAKIMQLENYMHIFQALKKIKHNNQEVTTDIFKPYSFLPGHKTGDLEQEIVDYFNNKELFYYTEEEVELIKKGVELWYIGAVSGCLILACRSLCKQYAAYNACQVLASTRMLEDYAHRRILETTQWVLDMHDPEQWNPEGKAVRSLQKLRLVHAMIRARIEGQINLDYPWKPEEWGQPINQQDMLFACNTFNSEVIDGYITAGYEYKDDVSYDDYALAWHYIGRGLGLLPELNPTTYQEAKEIQDRIYENEFQDENELGEKLAEALVKFVDELIPGENQESYVYALIKVYNDPDDYHIFTDILGIPLEDASQDFEDLFRAALKGDTARVDELESKFPDKVTEWVEKVAVDNYEIIDGFVQLNKTWTGNSFEVGDAFGDKAGRFTDIKRRIRQGTVKGAVDKLVSGIIDLGGKLKDKADEAKEKSDGDGLLGKIKGKLDDIKDKIDGDDDGGNSD